MLEQYLFVVFLISMVVIAIGNIIKCAFVHFIWKWRVESIGSVYYVLLISPIYKFALLSFELKFSLGEYTQKIKRLSIFLAKICENVTCYIRLKKMATSIKVQVILIPRKLLKRNLVRTVMELVSGIISESAKSGFLVKFCDERILYEILRELTTPRYILAVRIRDKSKIMQSDLTKGIMLEIPEKIFYEIPFSYSLYIGFRTNKNFVVLLGIFIIIKSSHNVDMEKMRINLFSMVTFILSVISDLSKEVTIIGFKIHFSKLLMRILHDKKALMIRKICSDKERKLFFERVGALFFTISSHNLNFPRLDIASNYTHGDAFIGWQLKNGMEIAPFFIKIGDLTRHMVIIGTTGSGKSSLAKIIVDDLSGCDYFRIWIFDFHGEYYDLNKRNIFNIIIPAYRGSISINMFEAPDEEDYAFFLSKLLIELIKLADYEVSPQIERIVSLATQDTILSENPSPLMFLWYLWKYSNIIGMPSPSHAFNAIINRIRPIFSGVSAEIFWVKRSNIDFRYLVNTNVIFDLSYLAKAGAYKHNVYLFVNLVLRYAFSELSKCVITSEKRFNRGDLKLLVLLEEAQYIVPWRIRKSSIETSPVEDLILLARKYGLGVIAIAPSSYVISQNIIRNAKIIVMFNGDYHDSGLLPDEKLVRYAQIMPTREAFVRIAGEGIIHIRTREYKYTEKTQNQSVIDSSIVNESNRIPISFDDAVLLIVKGKLTPNEIVRILESRD